MDWFQEWKFQENENAVKYETNWARVFNTAFNNHDRWSNEANMDFDGPIWNLQPNNEAHYLFWTHWLYLIQIY